MPRWTTGFTSPLGPLHAAADEAGALVGLGNRPFEGVVDEAPFAALRTWLEAYFARAPVAYTGALAPEGTPFQQRVWAALGEIPWGRTLSYGDLAGRLGDPKLTRAVGRANGANPIAILVPCHRVVGRDGDLVGYAGGLAMKRALLVHEGVLLC